MIWVVPKASLWYPVVRCAYNLFWTLANGVLPLFLPTPGRFYIGGHRGQRLKGHDVEKTCKRSSASVEKIMQQEGNHRDRFMGHFAAAIDHRLADHGGPWLNEYPHVSHGTDVDRIVDPQFGE
jgi:hypothetical protein